MTNETNEEEEDYDPDMEELADMAVMELQEFIDIETNSVIGDRQFMDVLSNWEIILLHSGQSINHKKTNQILNESSYKLEKIITLINEGILAELIIKEKEEEELEKLKTDKKTKLLKKTLLHTPKIIQKDIKLKTKELSKLHTMFEAFTRLINQVKDFDHYHLSELAKAVIAYEKAFRQRLDKEKLILEEFKK